jgi:hypothetical protein
MHGALPEGREEDEGEASEVDVDDVDDDGDEEEGDWDEEDEGEEWDPEAAAEAAELEAARAEALRETLAELRVRLLSGKGFARDCCTSSHGSMSADRQRPACKEC